MAGPEAPAAAAAARVDAGSLFGGGIFPRRRAAGVAAEGEEALTSSFGHLLDVGGKYERCFVRTESDSTDNLFAGGCWAPGTPWFPRGWWRTQADRRGGILPRHGGERIGMAMENAPFLSREETRGVALGVGMGGEGDLGTPPAINVYGAAPSFFPRFTQPRKRCLLRADERNDRS